MAQSHDVRLAKLVAEAGGDQDQTTIRCQNERYGEPRKLLLRNGAVTRQPKPRGPPINNP